MGFLEEASREEEFQERLHLTLLPTFALPDDTLTSFVERISGIACWYPALVIYPDTQVLLGEYHDIPAITVEDPTSTLQDLHAALLESAIDFGATFRDPKYVGEGFKPHISYPDGKSHYILKDLTVVEHRGGFGVDIRHYGPFKLTP